MHSLRRAGHGAVLGALVLATAGCGSSGSGDTASSVTKPAGMRLEGTSWVLDANTEGVPTAGVAVTAEFGRARITGNGGCNNYNASYRTSGHSLTIGPEIGATKKACDAARTAVEQAYLGRLPKVESYTIQGSKLTLFDGSATKLLVYGASDGSDAIAGTWTVTTYYTGTAVRSVIVGSTLTAEFGAGKVSGDSGCNTFGGPYVLDGTMITIGPFRSTLKACSDPKLQAQEQQYLAALELARTFRVMGSTLGLVRADGGVAATFEKT